MGVCMESIYSMTSSMLDEYFISIGEKKYRTKQLFDWIYVKRIKSFDMITNMKKEVIERLKSDFYFDNIEIVNKQSDELVYKYLLKLSDGNTIEAVGGQSTIKGNVIISNLYETEKPVTVVIAAYIDDTMISSKIINTSSKIQAGAVMNCPYELTGVETANNIKVFVWDSFEGMVPYCEASVK